MTHKSRLLRPLASLLTAAVAVMACQPSLPLPEGNSRSPATEPHAVLSPDAPLDAAPRVLRVRVIPESGASVDPARLLFVKGHVGDGHVRQLEDGDISQALAERAIPAAIWQEDNEAVLAPLTPLDPGETYGVLSGDPPLGLDLRVDPDDPVPLVPCVWPPADAPGTGTFALFCGTGTLRSRPTSLALDPGLVQGIFQPGVVARIGPSCLRIDALPATAPADSAPSGATISAPGLSATQAVIVLPPALLSLEETGDLRLDPRPIATIPPASDPVAPLACAEDEIPFGPGCARASDDRLFVASPEAPLFWSIRSEATGPQIRVTAPSETWVLTGLPPSETTLLEVTIVDVAGVSVTSTTAAHTSAPAPHVVISEVLANPLGAEPDQEWIELYNDGLAGADLTGHVLTDIGGETALPPAVLPPGAYALIVNDDFVEDDELDPVPVPETLVLRVPKLGKSGLKNDGEPLKLLDASGAIVSRFPALPKPKAGQSVARIDASSPSNDPSSFMVGPPTPGAANTD